MHFSDFFQDDGGARQLPKVNMSLVIPERFCVVPSRLLSDSSPSDRPSPHPILREGTKAQRHNVVKFVPRLRFLSLTSPKRPAGATGSCRGRNEPSTGPFPDH